MSDEPDNRMLRLLQELRGAMRDLRTHTIDLRTEMRDMRDDLTNRIDGNAIILNMRAGA